MSDRSQRRPRRHRSGTYQRIITYIAYAAYISLTSARARKEATVAALHRPVARAGRPGQADFAVRVGPGGVNGAGWPSALHSAPLGPPERRVGYSGHYAAFVVTGPCRARREGQRVRNGAGQGGRNGAGQGGVSPGGAYLAEARGAASDDSDKGNFFVQSTLWPDSRSHAVDYRSMRPFSTLVT